MQETWVQFLGWEDPLEKGKATHSSTLAWKIPQMEEPGRPYSPWCCKESDMTELLHFHFQDLFLQFFGVFLPTLLNLFCLCQVLTVFVLYCACHYMISTIGVSNFLEEISSLSHSIVFLYFFALITEEGFLISSCYSLNSLFKWVYLCFQIGRAHV